jgi:hypothetical protein
LKAIAKRYLKFGFGQMHLLDPLIFSNRALPELAAHE